MSLIIALVVVIAAFAFIILVGRVMSAAVAGTCPNCGNWWTYVDQHSASDNHRPGGRYVNSQCKCDKCDNVWGKTIPTFVPND